MCVPSLILQHARMVLLQFGEALAGHASFAWHAKD
jgi:hypothetical protein